MEVTSALGGRNGSLTQSCSLLRKIFDCDCCGQNHLQPLEGRVGSHPLRPIQAWFHRDHLVGRVFCECLGCTGASTYVYFPQYGHKLSRAGLHSGQLTSPHSMAQLSHIIENEALLRRVSKRPSQQVVSCCDKCQAKLVFHKFRGQRAHLYRKNV